MSRRFEHQGSCERKIRTGRSAGNNRRKFLLWRRPATYRLCDPITSNLYDDLQAGQIPEEALLASLGCGNPTALAQLNPGEVVLDLGSGGGIDVSALRQASGADRQSLRPGHDRRDAGSGEREQTQIRN